MAWQVECSHCGVVLPIDPRSDADASNEQGALTRAARHRLDHEQARQPTTTLQTHVAGLAATYRLTIEAARHRALMYLAAPQLDARAADVIREIADILTEWPAAQEGAAVIDVTDTGVVLRRVS